MVGLRSCYWLVSLFAGPALLTASLFAAINPIGDVTPFTIGQVPSSNVFVGNEDVGG